MAVDDTHFPLYDNAAAAVYRKTISHTDSGQLSIGDVPEGTAFLRAYWVPNTTFDAVGATISFGTSGDAASIFGTSLFDLTSVGQDSVLGNIVDTSEEYFVDFTQGTGGTAGEGTVYIIYVGP